MATPGFPAPTTRSVRARFDRLPQRDAGELNGSQTFLAGRAQDEAGAQIGAWMQADHQDVAALAELAPHLDRFCAAGEILGIKVDRRGLERMAKEQLALNVTVALDDAVDRGDVARAIAAAQQFAAVKKQVTLAIGPRVRLRLRGAQRRVGLFAFLQSKLHALPTELRPELTDVLQYVRDGQLDVIHPEQRASLAAFVTQEFAGSQRQLQAYAGQARREFATRMLAVFEELGSLGLIGTLDLDQFGQVDNARAALRQAARNDRAGVMGAKAQLLKSW